MSKKQISFVSYQKMAEYYFNQIDEKSFNAYYERPATLSLLPEVNGKKVLDAGCAAGWYTEWLIDHNAEVTAIDFSPHMIKMTKKRVGEQANIIKADLNNSLNFLEIKSFDIIVSSLTLHYIKDWHFVMKEFNKILKPNGSLIISIHHPFMVYDYFDVENYFKIELLKDYWKVKNKKIEVEFYHRPLGKITSPILDNGFSIEKLLEPMPTEEFKINDPENYKRLKKKPQFLFIKSKKESDI